MLKKIIPLVLATTFALTWFWPSTTQLVGWGDDPAFNLWTFEQVWIKLDTLGPWNIPTAEFWDTPLFSPTRGTLALSENQILPALISWPIRRLTGNGVLTLGILAATLSLAAFVFSFLFFESLGLKLAAWGALLFQACGWIQDHYAHYQNICIFVFPLCFWSWNRFLKQPNWKSLLLFTFALGSVGGWNLYFQVFLNISFAALILRAFHQQKELRPWLGRLIAWTMLFELFFAWHYFEIGKNLGTFSVTSGDFQNYSAYFSSVISHGHAVSFLQNWIPFYPHLQTSIERVGFLGIAWIGLAFLSWKNKTARAWIIAAALCFWIALGPHFGLHGLMKVFPGFSALRAIGRLQILVTFFSLTGVLIFLEQQKPRFQCLAFAFLFLELVPGQWPERVAFPLSFWGEKTELEHYWETHPSLSPLLLVGRDDAFLQLSLVRSQKKIFQGYSGRSPLNAHLIWKIGTDTTDPHPLQTKLFFTQAAELISADAATSALLKSEKFLKSEGCYAHHNLQICVWTPHFTSKEDLGRSLQPRLRLDQDAHWEYPHVTAFQANLIADRDGMLDYETTGRCRQLERLMLGPIPLPASTHAMSAHPFQHVEFKKGDTILTETAKQWIYTWPEPIRISKRMQIDCR